MRPVRSHPLAVSLQSDASWVGVRGGEVGRKLILQWNFIGQTASLHFNLRAGRG